MNKVSFSLAFLLVLSNGIFAQLAPPLSAKTNVERTNILVLGKTPFSIEIKGKKHQQLESREDGFLYSVDGKMLNITITKASVVIGKEKVSGDENLLKAHQKWELNFQSNFLFQKPLAVAEEEAVFINLTKISTQRTLFWYFNTPEPSIKSSENRRAFQTTLIGDVFLALGSLLEKEDSLVDHRQFFNEVLSSLKIQKNSKRRAK